ncbi:metallophosphoesterase family protein [Granulicella mallensis]|uniref:Metallophosphoesterase n=1 Tax=Granulicella mallensis (strain ATCC BAA-1857 / DSM 23137 / MP5ACTX8) TaxID=682795 RepID=G8NTR3_GRAMM|nr:metallophosphoesterase [Granulicella mallensis]AEU36387.1 metallophosphoesterase [Granulicella mallensis MP5ACTX8]
MDRRHFLSLLGAAGTVATLGHSPVAQAEPASAQDFDFIFLTDTHIQPELDATKGCDMAFKKMRTFKADFAIQGGDHIFDGLAVPKSRSISLFDLYDKTQQDLSLPVYHTIGNHDCLGIYTKSGIEPTDPQYGKKYYEEHVSKLYYSFEHKGTHFIVLDSIGLTPDRAYEGRIDAAQLQWLADDLKAQPAGTPIIVTSHIPIVSAIDSYSPVPATPPAHHGNTVANSSEVIQLFEGHNVLGVLQGHTHVNERVEWHGVPYITSGAVSGNWWQGIRLGAAEGFTVVSLRGGKLTTRYETYGFKSIDPHNT